ncbi:solute carrier family 35, member E1 [Entomortierella parvispora]|uniref:Solute carrier family 35, member E1 n=1 Tax=Entomortierella parvispora TaxID=205924 RepID=A0A9P3HC59_9FUNG|nr:solute carrier family 35, member E1 [Entomortierella parvispora]
MATMATASTVAPGSPFVNQQPLGYPASSASSAPSQPTAAGPNHTTSQAQSQSHQAIHRQPDPFSQMPTADALFEALANQNNQESSIDNPLSVHVQQLPTPRTSFSSGANSPPENLSPSFRGDVHHLSHHHTTHPYLTPTSLSASSSYAPSSATTPQPTFQSTIASTTTNPPSVLGQGAASLPSPARSPLSTGHLYQPQSYPSLRSASPAMNNNPYPTLGPALYGPSATSNHIAPVHGSTGVYNANGTLGGRQQPTFGEAYHKQQDHQELYYDDEKEQQKRNARDAINGVAAYLPPVLNQGLSKVMQSAQAAVQASNSKMSLPSSRPQMDGGMLSSSIPAIESKSLSGMVRKLYKASKLPLLCLLWYLSSAVTNNIGKQIMNQFRYPITLTFVQFLFVSLFCFLGGSVFRLTTIRTPTWGIISMTAPLVGFQVVGHVFSSFAISRVPLSVVHTIKALSPLFTVVFYRIILGTTYSRAVYVSLVPLTAGVMLACRLSLEFNNLVGLCCALASMLVFVTQNVFTKKILFSTKAKSNSLGNKEDTGASAEDIGSSNAQKLDKLNILFYSSTMAAICMVPIWLYAEGMGLMFPDGAGVVHHATGHGAASGGVFSSVAWLLLLNGISHFFQNIFAFSVLALTSPVTYSIASLIKRIVVIVASIVYFHQTLGVTQWTGVCLTFWGLWLYNNAKNAAKVNPAGGILTSTKVGRRMSRNFGKGFGGFGQSDRKGGFLA